MIKKYREFIKENKEELKVAPDRGYILPKWDMGHAYRATALAYIDREDIWTIENKDGLWYSRSEIENSMLNNDWTDYHANMNESNDEREDDFVCPECGEKGTTITIDEIDEKCPNCGSDLEIDNGQYE